MSTSNHLAAVAGLIRGAAADLPEPTTVTAHSREVSVYLKSLDDLRSWASFLEAPAPIRRRLGDSQDVWESDAVWSGLGGIATPVRLAHVSVGVVGVAS